MCKCGGKGFIFQDGNARPCICSIDDYAKKNFKKIYIPANQWATKTTIEAKLKQWRKKNRVFKLDNDLRMDMCPTLYVLNQTVEKFLVLDIMDIVNATFARHRMYENLDHLNQCAENFTYVLLTMGVSPVNFKFGLDTVTGFIRNFSVRPNNYLWVLYECDKLQKLSDIYSSHLYDAVKKLQPGAE